MRAVCPSCEAIYEIPDRLVGAGRRLRCANCGHQWALVPPGAAETPPPAAPEPPPAKAPPVAQPAPAEAPPVAPPLFGETPPPPSHDASAPRGAPPTRPMLRRPPQVIDPPLPPVDDNTGRRRRGDLALVAAWIGSVLVVVLALVAFWAFRYEIVAAWPPAARLVGTPTGGG